MDCRANRRNKPLFSNSSDVVCAGPNCLIISGQRRFKFDILTGEGQLTHQRGSGLGIPSPVLLHTSQRTFQPIKQDK